MIEKPPDIAGSLKKSEFSMDMHTFSLILFGILVLVIIDFVISRDIQNEVWEDVRLANGGSVYQGRVEVKVNGTWGTVCDDRWSTFDGIVVCKQLGFDGLLNIMPGGAFGPGKGPIWHDDLECTSRESSLSDCPGHHDPNTTDCLHAEDAAVRCLPPAPRYKTRCRENQFLCTSQQKCIPARWVCDDQDDCNGNKEDELRLLCTKQTNCGVQTVPPISKRIVGGQAARPGTWPWMVLIKIVFPHGLGAQNLCGGTLIAAQWILTAAHCFDKYTPSTLRVVVGETDTNVTEGTEQEFIDYSIHTHKDYVAGSHLNDIALLQLRHPVNMSRQNVNLACLPLYKERPFTATDTCYVTGWGDTKGQITSDFTFEKINDQGSGNRNILQQAQVPILNNTQCSGWYNGSQSVDMSQGILCAGYQFGGKDACKGDSGGPLVCLRDGRWTVAGVVIWGEGCAQVQRPGIYTDVAHFKQWIAETIETSPAPYVAGSIGDLAIG